MARVYDGPSGALFNDDKTKRYLLWRRWGGTDRPMFFVMLNPSTADSEDDDPTIRRCVGFAKRENCGGILVVNLFAERTSKPEELFARVVLGVRDERNEKIVAQTLRFAVTNTGLLVAAWGANGAHPAADERRKQLRAAVPSGDDLVEEDRLLCLGKTKEQHPRHPLMVAADAPFVPYETTPDLKTT